MSPQATLQSRKGQYRLIVLMYIIVKICHKIPVHFKIRSTLLLDSVCSPFIVLLLFCSEIVGDTNIFLDFALRVVIEEGLPWVFSSEYIIL